MDKKHRYRERKYLIEGEKLVREAIRFGQKIECIFCSEQSPFAAEELGFPVYTASDNVLKSLSDAVTPQGVTAVLTMPPTANAPPRGKCLVLDNIQDPGNLGAIIRTAAATGYADVYLANCADPYSPKVVRSAMSAHFAVNIYQGALEEIFVLVKQRCQIVCADMGGQNVFGVRVEPAHALVIGNEGNGLSVFSLRQADVTVSLPMKNNFESLNAAVSAGVLMYQLGKEE